jgi:hypothetical protein
MSVTAAAPAPQSVFQVNKDQSDLCFVAFALGECTVKTDPRAAKYLRAVHRTALELAVANYFGASVGGFWLTEEHIARLRALPEHYPANEAPDAARAVDAYLEAQLQGFYFCAYSTTH